MNDNQNDWEDHLSAVLFAYRTAQQKATKLSPFEIMYCGLVFVIASLICTLHLPTCTQMYFQETCIVSGDAVLNLVYKCTSSKAVLPVEMQFSNHACDSSPGELEWSADEVLECAQRMIDIKKTIHQKAKANIDVKQVKDKEYYDRKHAHPKVICFSVLNKC